MADTTMSWIGVMDDNVPILNLSTSSTNLILIYYSVMSNISVSNTSSTGILAMWATDSPLFYGLLGLRNASRIQGS